MKGIILGIAPEVSIVDVSHEIEPQNFRQAGYVLSRHVFYFPEGTIHVAVVDPGVGTARRPIAVQTGPQRFVGPDNGLFTRMYERAEKEGWPLKVVHLDKPEYWLSKISNVFHGRDIFSPVAAHLSRGVPLEEVGMPISDAVRVELPRVQRTDSGVFGEVLHVDHFGNIASNIHKSDLDDLNTARALVKLNNTTIEGILRTFGERPPGELVALFGSTEFLIISVVNGSAAERLKSKVGDKVEVTLA